MQHNFNIGGNAARVHQGIVTPESTLSWTVNAQVHSWLTLFTHKRQNKSKLDFSDKNWKKLLFWNDRDIIIFIDNKPREKVKKIHNM